LEHSNPLSGNQEYPLLNLSFEKFKNYQAVINYKQTSKRFNNLGNFDTLPKSPKGLHSVFYINVGQGNINFVCAWFDEKIYYESSPTSARVKL